MNICKNLHGFDTVFDGDEYVEIGAEENDKRSLMAQGVAASAYEKQLVASVFWSQALHSNADKARFHRSTSPKVLGGDFGLVRYHDERTEGSMHVKAQQFQNWEAGRPRTEVL